MKNLDRWRFYFQEIQSPDSFIDWGFYSLISSALQRRVWTGSNRLPLFANTYVTLVGPAGVGKGLVIGEVNKVLRFHKRNKSTEETEVLTLEDKDPRKILEEKLLIRVGAEATTCEALIRELSKSTIIHWYKNEEGKRVPYFHASVTFCLEELSSLFRKHTENLVNFLLTTYDCKDYRYDTISRNTDCIKNPCLSLLAGTTPEFIKRIFGDELITNGYASRTVFLFEEKNRFERARPPEFTDEQKAEYSKILDHIRILSSIYGEVKFSLECINYLETWWKTAKINKPNTSPKLIPYYARKNVTVQKLAMILHFSNNLTLEVSTDELKQAINILEISEISMHRAVNVSDKNPLAIVTNDIENYICRNGPIKRRELLIQFWGDLPEQDQSLQTILEYLTITQKIKPLGENKYGKFKTD